MPRDAGRDSASARWATRAPRVCSGIGSAILGMLVHPREPLARPPHRALRRWPRTSSRPCRGSTVTKYSHGPSAGCSAASIARSPGLPIGPGGIPGCTYVLYALPASARSASVVVTRCVVARARRRRSSRTAAARCPIAPDSRRLRMTPRDLVVIVAQSGFTLHERGLDDGLPPICRRDAGSIERLELTVDEHLHHRVRVDVGVDGVRRREQEPLEPRGLRRQPEFAGGSAAAACSSSMGIPVPSEASARALR